MTITYKGYSDPKLTDIDFSQKVISQFEKAVLKTDKTYGGHVDFTVYDGDKRISVSRFSAWEAWHDAYERMIGDRPKIGG